MKLYLVLSLLACIMFGLLQIATGRPNPVPDENVDLIKQYEEQHAKMTDFRPPRRRRRNRSEDPDDQEVLDELSDHPFFHNIQRKNLYHYPSRPNIFQKAIDARVYDSDDSE